MEKKNLAILIFDDVEVLDFAGPFEIFSVTNELNKDELLNVYTIALTKDPIHAKNGLKVIADYTLETCPKIDCLIIPGGSGTRKLLINEPFLAWVTQTAPGCDHLLSICSGALVLAVTGMLNGLSATTHHQVFDELIELAPETQIVRNQRFVDNGKIITSAGVAAGMDMSLYMVAKLYGQKTAAKTAQYIEYEYASETISA